MAKKYGNANKYAAKRRYYRKKKKLAMYGRRRFSNVQGTLIPDRTCVTMKYNEDVRIQLPPNGIMASYIYRCNSIFDPNLTGIGHQPMGHDQYANFYKKYVVIGSTMTVTFKSFAASQATNDPVTNATVAVTTIQGTSGVISNPSELLENNRTSYTNLCVQRPYAKITKKFSPKRFFGLTKMLDNEDYGADFGSNPAQDALWQISGYNPTAPGNPTTLYLNIAIKYICVLRERVNLGLS